MFAHRSGIDKYLPIGSSNGRSHRFSARGQRVAILTGPLHELTGLYLAVNRRTPGCHGERRFAVAELANSPSPAPTGHVYGYARLQADEGESLDVQQRVLVGYATMQGLTIDRMFVERGVSGSKPLGERPEGAALLAVLQSGDTVITPKLDRMFRSALDALNVLGKLKATGVSLHMIDLGGDTTGNGVSKLVFTILSAVAEAERDRTRERVAEVKRDQRQRGRYSVVRSHGAVASARPASWCPSPSSRRRSADAQATRPGPRAAGDRGEDEGSRRVDQPCRGEERPRRCRPHGRVVVAEIIGRLGRTKERPERLALLRPDGTVSNWFARDEKRGDRRGAGRSRTTAPR